MTQFAGHRVLRLLATGERSRVWLAADDVALKVIAAPFGPGQPAAEVEALHRARGDHVVELLDVSVDDEHAVLVFPRLPRGSLADVLTGRAGLDAGEAVTALVPIAGALARMHAAGVAHGSLSPAAVLFRSDGAPMLCGFGRAELFASGLPEVQCEKQAGVVADRTALAVLAVDVLSRVTGARAAAAADLASSFLPGSTQIDLEARLTAGLFELAAARPIVLDAPGTDWASARAVSVAAVPEPEPEVPAAGSLAASVAGVLASALESGPTAMIRRRALELWSAWSPGRRRLTLGGGAGLIAVLVAVAVVPAQTPRADPAAAPQVSDEQVIPPSSPAVAGDDPLAALTALLDRREHCFRDLSVLCLDDVAEQGSAALDADRAALDDILASGRTPAPISASGASMVERLGDSALISLGPDSDPASVLLLKGEAGWRIRDYLEG